MSIDSRDKRASALAGYVSPLVAPFAPDGTMGAADRQHVGGWAYRGIAAGAPVAVTAVYIAGTVYGPAASGTASAPAYTAILR